MVALLIFMLADQFSQYRKDVASTGAQTPAFAHSRAFLVEGRLQAYIDALQVLAGSDALRSGDLGRFRLRAAAIVAWQSPGATVLLLRELAASEQALQPGRTGRRASRLSRRLMIVGMKR